MSGRDKIYEFILRKIFRIEEGGKLHWYGILVRSILYPSTLLWLANTDFGMVRIHKDTDILEIDGYRFTIWGIRTLIYSNRPTVVVQRKDKVVTIKELRRFSGCRMTNLWIDDASKAE